MDLSNLKSLHQNISVMRSLAIPTSNTMNYKDVELKNKAALDPLVQAALDGDVQFLRKVCEENINDLSSYFLRPTSNGNFIHRAVKKNHYTFLSEALKVLPPNVVLELVCKTDTVEGSNPLHYAAKEGNIFTVKLLVKAFVTALEGMPIKGIPPWLRKNKAGNTPLHCCFMKNTSKSHECIARYIVSEETNLRMSLGEQNYPSATHQSSTMVKDGLGASILYCAIREGFFQLAEQILTSRFPYSLSGTYGQNALHHLSRCNERVSKLLLKQHPELCGVGPTFGETILDRAVEDNAVGLVRLMLIEVGDREPWFRACRRLIWHMNPRKDGDTPLHIAARKGYIDIAKLLVQGYESAIEDQAEEWDVANEDNTNDCLVSLLLRDRQGTTAYQIALENGCEQSRKMILEKTDRRSREQLSTWASSGSTFHPSVLKIIQHFASKCAEMGQVQTSNGVVRLMVEGLPMFIKDKTKDAKYHLKKAVERKADWLVRLLLEGDRSLIEDSTPAWRIACEKGYLSTLLAIVEQYDPQEFIYLCRESKQTPLHHIKLPGTDQYRALLANPVMQGFKNELDSDGATPLHRAIERNYLNLTQALLQTKGIRLDIEDSNHKMALELLEEKCITNYGFFQLYKELLADPLTMRGWKNRVDNNGDTSLHRAIARGDRKLVTLLVETKGIKLEIKNTSEKTALDLIEELCFSTQSDDKYWYDLYKSLPENLDRLQMLKNRIGGSGSTPLHIAIYWDDVILGKALALMKGIDLNIKDGNGKTALDWIEERSDHIDSPWYELYKELFNHSNNMDELKNRKGLDDKTPLHRAIKLGDIAFTKTLLETTGVYLNIKDWNGKTALDLLNESYNTKKWGDMCREMRLDPIFKVKYLQRRTSLKDMHNTLSVVAALLATITFAAGFTIPGGVDSNDGRATLGTKAAFLVFSITNTIAMCSSMLVLFTVTGAMIWEVREDDTFLIDLCVSLLQFSLCGTILAFMTGVYAIMAPKVLWVGIVVIILCSFAFCGAMFAMCYFWPILYRPTKYVRKSMGKLASHLKRDQSGSGQAMNTQQMNSQATMV